MSSIYKDTRRGTWQIRRQITADGRKYNLHKSLPDWSTKAEVHEAAAELDRRAELIRRGQYQSAVLLFEAIDRWKLHMARHSSRTQTEYQNVLDAFTDSLPPFVRFVGDVKSADIEGYQLHRINLGNKARTANYHLVAIKSFFRWASQFYGFANPASVVKLLPEQPPTPRCLSPAEYTIILKSCPIHIRQRIEFLANTGLRATEFCSLRWNHISQDRHALTIIGKGCKRRTIPLNEICRRILDELMPAVSTHIFLSKSHKKHLANKPINRKTLSLMCRSIAKTLNLESFGPHALRHYFATRLLVAGVPIAKVSKLLGHSSIKTTEQIYIHILPDDLAGVTDCLVGP